MKFLDQTKYQVKKRKWRDKFKFIIINKNDQQVKEERLRVENLFQSKMYFNFCQKLAKLK